QCSTIRLSCTRKISHEVKRKIDPSARRTFGSAVRITLGHQRTFSECCRRCDVEFDARNVGGIVGAAGDDDNLVTRSPLRIRREMKSFAATVAWYAYPHLASLPLGANVSYIGS